MLNRSEQRVWEDFRAWCRRRRLAALPAHPWTVAAYLRWCAACHRQPALQRRLSAIVRGHLLGCVPSPDRHPVVGRTLHQIEVQKRPKPKPPSLFRPDDFAQPAAAPKAPRKRRGLGTTPPLVRKKS